MQANKFLMVFFIMCLVSYTTLSQSSATIFISADSLHQKISKDIYGMFSEHLGRDIYGGFWVGNNPDIPNKNGIRLDIVNALKAIKIPVLRWPGDVLPMNITGGIA